MMATRRCSVKQVVHFVARVAVLALDGAAASGARGLRFHWAIRRQLRTKLAASTRDYRLKSSHTTWISNDGRSRCDLVIAVRIHAPKPDRTMQELFG